MFKMLKNYLTKIFKVKPIDIFENVNIEKLKQHGLVYFNTVENTTEKKTTLIFKSFDRNVTFKQQLIIKKDNDEFLIPNLNSSLLEALKEEDYESAVKIRNQIDKNQKQV